MITMSKRRIIFSVFIFVGIFFYSAISFAELNALLIGDNVPSEMHPGERRKISVIMENTGDEPWSDTGFRLYSVSDPRDTWAFTSSEVISDGITIEPGMQKNFVLYLDAPTTPGTYESKWQMYVVSTQTFFGDILLDTIWVDESVIPEWDAVLIDHTLPVELYPGEPRLVEVTFQNTGSGNWTGNRYAVSAYKNDPPLLWSTDLFQMIGDEETVAPGEQRTFPFIITAPVEEALYESIWQMVHIHIYSHFGEFVSQLVNVSSSVTPELGHLLIDTTIPSSMCPGETRNVAITLENIGTVTWDENNVRLRAVNNLWNSDHSYHIDAGETVAFGEQKTFSFSITAPLEEGTFECAWQMQGYWADLNQHRNIDAPVSIPVIVSDTSTEELNASIVSYSIPSVIQPDETVPVTVTVQNTGTVTWYGNDTERIRLMSKNVPSDLWGTLNVYLDDSDEIGPGQEKIFTFDITAPSVQGATPFTWQMQKQWDVQDTFFGDEFDIIVTVGDSVPTRTLDIDVDPAEGGTTAPAVGSHLYNENEVVTISASPNPGYQFDSWTGDVADPLAQSTTVTLDADKTVTANFILTPTYTLSIDVDSTGGGTTTPSAGTHIYYEGDVATISASPFTGYRFLNWSGDVADPIQQTTTVVMDSDKTITAYFEETGLTPVPAFISLDPDSGSSQVGTPIAFTLTVGDGDGFDDLTTVKMVIKEGPGTATTSDAIALEYRSYRPDRIWMFNHIEGRWVHAVAGTTATIEDNLCALDLSQSSLSGAGDTLTFTFTIIPKAALLDDPLTGSKTIWLLARDSAGNIINNVEIGLWDLMVGSPAMLTLDVDPPASGMTTPSLGSHTYNEGDVVSINATPNPGYQFDSWTGEVADPYAQTTTVTMDTDRTVIANFTLVPTYTLSIDVDPAEGGATAPAAGSHVYNENEVVTITASTNPGYQFDSWTGDVADPSAATTTVTMDTDKAVTANFTPAPAYTLSIDVDSSGGGTTTPSVGTHIYYEGDVVTISASPFTGYRFLNWSGDVADPNQATTTVVLDSDKTVTAYFEETGLTPLPAFISLEPDSGSSPVGTPITFTLTVGDGDGFDDLTTVKMVIKEGPWTSITADAIVLEYRSYRPDRIWMFNHIEGRWNWAVAGTPATIEDNLCTLDLSQSTISGAGETLTFTFTIIPKAALLDDPLTGQKRIWLLLRDSEGNIVNNLEIGSWTVSAN